MVSVSPLRTTLDDVCFCHWPVDPDAPRLVVPDWLTVEAVDGDAWISAVAHTVERVRAFGVDLTRPAAAVNLRTYVRGPTDQRGVYFLGLYTDDRFTREAAGRLLGLPYRRGRLAVRHGAGGSTRRTLDVDGRRALDVEYTPADSDGTTAPPDSLAGFLVERERYFATGPAGTRLVGSVGHDPWRLVPVEASVGSAPLELVGLEGAVADPLVHYSPGIEVSLAPPTPLAGSRRR
ncbi:DUF2071 domain-containing protein [Halomicroarcula sp. GCM10025817]|uniref:DUF2071 domain-containing protein n=1 Tax=Haloarcula TaxID=2237 RepID=UPI0023E8C850|nr:DUF2071 domain-containing protein [Halomicroarcula sp. SYNS111]